MDRTETDEFDKKVHRILLAAAEAIARCREACDGIVFVVHDPSAIAFKALRRLQVTLRQQGTSVFACACSKATALWGLDADMRRWCSEQPASHELKVFLSINDQFMFMTLRVEDGNLVLVDELQRPRHQPHLKTSGFRQQVNGRRSHRVRR